ncbi:uncharacterized protein [Eleutherodactylus coqui]|uniref:uncharacterized protein n=1 Tax=Eleutherodactylus coqui TaxID=57060 RepID=UPI0034629E37
MEGAGSSCSTDPHVTAPETWRLGVLESVFIRASQQLESFPVKVSVVSYPDKTTTFSSALLRLTPENRFRGSVMLSIAAEDSPGEFVDLVVESEAFRKEMRIPVTGATQSPRNQPGLKRRRRRSLLSSHDTKIMKNRYPHPRLQQCCLNGSNHYSAGMDCQNGLLKLFKEAKEGCRRAAEECCNYTKDHMFKDMPMAIQSPERPKEGLEQAADTGRDLEQPADTRRGLEQPADTGRGLERATDTGRGLEEQITITVIQTTDRGRVTSTFTVKIDPTEDVSVEVSSKSFSSKVDIAVRNAPPADEDY